MRRTFKSRFLQAKLEGFFLERDRRDDHPYCLWFNSLTASKEIWIKNLGDEFEQAFAELKNIKNTEK